MNVIFAGRSIPLNEACEARDQCEDINASCRNGICLCQTGYYEHREKCGKLNSYQTTKLVSHIVTDQPEVW